MKTEERVPHESADWEPEPWIPFPAPGPGAVSDAPDPLIARIVWILEEAPDAEFESE